MPTLERDGDVFVLDLGDGENRFNPDWVEAVFELIDQAAQAESPRALVTTARGKIWSNGLDLDWMGAHVEQINPFMERVHELFARVLTLEVPTIAAIQGHCFAAGAMLALAHDFRVMRADRGFLCLPEADIGIPFSPGMSDLIRAKLAPATAVEAMTTARRYGGLDAASAGIVDHAVEEADVLPVALELARPLAAKAGATLGTIKQRMWASVALVLRDGDANRIAIPGT
jgi:enoyl-CoA hydratase/carnithine racemase